MFAKITDPKGNTLKEVVAIFRAYKPYIEQHMAEITAKRGISAQEIAHLLQPQTPLAAISLRQLNAIAQVVFLRPAGKERDDLQADNQKFIPYTNDSVFHLFRSIGDIGPLYPSLQTYDYILLNGSTLEDMRFRLQTLEELVAKKRLIITPTTEIIFLTGERDLYLEENEAQLKDPHPLQQNPHWKPPLALPTTEDQAAEWIWEQSELHPSLRQAHIIFIRAKKKIEKDPITGKEIKKRPNTYDTVQAWIHGHQPRPGACLMVSNQPYVYYQQATLEAALKKAGLLSRGFTVEGTGLSPEPEDRSYFTKHIAIFLDNFARTIYTEMQKQSK
jgi:hypothetical protein